MRTLMRRGLRASAVLALVPMFAVTGATSADAATGNGSGVDVTGVQAFPNDDASYVDSPKAKADKQLSEATLKLRTLYLERAQTKGAGATKLDAKITEAQRSVEQLSGKKIESYLPEPSFSTSSERVAGASMADPDQPYPRGKLLRFVHSAQSKSYWCGPGSTAMVIRATMPASQSETSKYDGAKMTQTELASSTYLKTTTSGTYIGNIATTLTRWTGKSGWQAHGGTVYGRSALTASQLKTLIVTNVATYDAGAVLGTREVAGGAHYNSHPASQTIEHFIAVYGYNDNGSSFYYGDPAANSAALSSAWNNVRESYSATVSAAAPFVAKYGAVA